MSGHQERKDLVRPELMRGANLARPARELFHAGRVDLIRSKASGCPIRPREHGGGWRRGSSASGSAKKPQRLRPVVSRGGQKGFEQQIAHAGRARRKHASEANAPTTSRRLNLRDRVAAQGNQRRAGSGKNFRSAPNEQQGIPWSHSVALARDLLENPPDNVPSFTYYSSVARELSEG